MTANKLETDKPVLRSLMKSSIIGFALVLAATASMANDPDRITALEKEVQELKSRLSQLEVPQATNSKRPTVSVTNEGWKYLANWRSLKKGMSPDEVRAVLGEPANIRAGAFTYWQYSGDGRVTFLKDAVYGWDEPR